MTLCFSQYLTAPMVAISLVKDCLFSFSGHPETNNVLALQCLPKSPMRPWGLETFTNTPNHRKPPEEQVCLLLSPPPPQLLTGNGFGTRELEKGQRWVREKHRWLSDGLALSDPDPPTQSQHLRGHFHETSKISLFRLFQPPVTEMVHRTSCFYFWPIYCLRKKASDTCFLLHFWKKPSLLY